MVTTTNRTLNGLVIRMGTFISVTVLATGAETWPIGAVLARQTSSGKYVRFVEGGSGGAEVPSAVLTSEITFAGAGDLSASVAASGEFRVTHMTDASDAALVAKAIFDLRTYDIFAQSVRDLTIKDNQ